MPIVSMITQRCARKSHSPQRTIDLSKITSARKKPPRTVHIDVYCTGSDETENVASDGERVENRSNNSKMLFESDQLRLKHTKIWNRDELPRYLHEKYKRKQHESSEANIQALRDYILAQCDSNDEMNESKQILFAKHIGDESSVRDSDVSLRNSFKFQCEPNDDGLSTDYPTSSRSNLSEDAELSWAENANVKEGWRNPEQVRVQRTIDAVTEDIERSTSQLVEEFEELVRSMEKDSKQRTPVTPDPSSAASALPTVSEDTPPPLKRQSMQIFEEKKAIFRNKLRSAPHAQEEEKKRVQRSWGAYKINGLNREHLIRASKFGTVIDAILKPGHHIGPVRNPDCLCQHCRAYFAEARTTRDRAFSVGNDRVEKAQPRPSANREHFF